MKTLLLLLLSYLLTSSALARPRPRSWRGFGGPAYLAGLARRPNQHKLDSLARAAHLRKSQLAVWSK